MERKTVLSELEPGELFDDALPNDPPSRERIYRVIGVRTRTLIAENLLGVRRSFTRSHEAVRASRELWDRLAATASPATPFQRGAASEGRTEAG